MHYIFSLHYITLHNTNFIDILLFIISILAVSYNNKMSIL